MCACVRVRVRACMRAFRSQMPLPRRQLFAIAKPTASTLTPAPPLPILPARSTSPRPPPPPPPLPRTRTHSWCTTCTPTPSRLQRGRCQRMTGCPASGMESRRRTGPIRAVGALDVVGLDHWIRLLVMWGMASRRHTGAVHAVGGCFGVRVHTCSVRGGPLVCWSSGACVQCVWAATSHRTGT